MRLAWLFVLGAACSTYTNDDSAPANDAGAASSSSSGGVDAGSDSALPGTVEPAAPLGCPSAGRSCVAEAPAGWNGPLIVYDGDEAAVPSCPAEMNEARVDSHRGLEAPAPHGCSACQCSVALGVTCKVIHEELNATCDVATPGTDKQVLTNTCELLKKDVGHAIELVGSGGSCSASGGKPTRPAVQWDSATRACGAASLLRTGCAAGEICTPDPPSPFRGKHCISQSGDQACPGAPYTEKLLTNGADDTRDCTKCSCGAVETFDCAGTVQKFNSGNCGLATEPATSLPLACSKSDADRSIKASNVHAGPGSTCAAGPPATPTGSVTAGSPITICCAP